MFLSIKHTNKKVIKGYTGASPDNTYSFSTKNNIEGHATATSLNWWPLPWQQNVILQWLNSLPQFSTDFQCIKWLSDLSIGHIMTQFN